MSPSSMSAVWVTTTMLRTLRCIAGPQPILMLADDLSKGHMICVDKSHDKFRAGVSAVEWLSRALRRYPHGVYRVSRASRCSSQFCRVQLYSAGSVYEALPTWDRIKPLDFRSRKVMAAPGKRLYAQVSWFP